MPIVIGPAAYPATYYSLSLLDSCEHGPQIGEKALGVFAHGEMPHAVHDGGLSALDAAREIAGVVGGAGVVVLTGEQIERAAAGIDLSDFLAQVPVHDVVIEIATEHTGGNAGNDAVSQGIAPEVLCVAFGVIAGIPAGALMALSAQALSADNRGPGLGIFYTWYYAGMTVGPVLAGWTRDVSGSAAAPVILGAALLGGVILSVGVLRLLQASRKNGRKP